MKPQNLFTIATGSSSSNEGIDRITVLTDGSVGIGTDSPSSLLTVDGTATITGNVELNTTTSNATTVNGRLQVTPGTFSAPGIRNSSNGNTGFVAKPFLQYAGNERILADGNVGIGTAPEANLTYQTGNNERVVFVQRRH